MACRGEHAFADVLFRDEQGRAGGLSTVLRSIGEQGLLARLDVWGDVDDEGRANVGVERSVEDFERTVRCAVLWRDIGAGEACEEAGFIAECGGGVVVGMAALPIGEDDDAGTQTAEHCGDFESVLEGVLNIRVGQVEGFAVRDFQDASGFGGLGGAFLGGASGTSFALGEVEDAGAGAERLLHEEGAAAGLLHVVTMGGYREDVDERCRHVGDMTMDCAGRSDDLLLFALHSVYASVRDPE